MGIMPDIFRIFRGGGKSFEEIKNTTKSSQSVENVILQRINNKIREFEEHIAKIENLNIKEEMSSNNNLTEEQIKELSEVVSSLNLLLDIFLDIKNYIVEYVKEIQNNPYIPPTQRAEIINTLKTNLYNVKKKIEKTFIEVEFFVEKLNFM